MKTIATFVFAMSIVLNAMASSIDQRHVSDVQFVAEKTGKVETELEQKVIQTLHNYPEVDSAYLVLVTYPNASNRSVALCVRSKGGDERAIAKSIGEDFSSLFNSSQALDILFVNDTQEEQIRRVAKPFYLRS
jgi:hypothetical protein